MLGFDLRDKDDVVEDLIKVGEIASEYKKYKDMLQALVLKYNIQEMQKCNCRNYKNNLSFQERLHCSQCGGIGYIISYKEKENENEV